MFPTRDLDGKTLGEVVSLFHDSYREGDEAHLRRSLDKLRFIATARSRDGLAGFALGEMRVMDLPRLAAQTVALAGVCCIASPFRRSGLFRTLGQRAISAGDVENPGRVLHCGRVAHPASFRTMTWNPTHVPKRSVPPTPWQREIGAAIAAAYGVRHFDPETFVCIGNGRPIGYPLMDIEVEPEEWEVFASVDRGRGDALLGFFWMPDAPEGWMR